MNYLFIKKCVDQALRSLRYPRKSPYAVERARDIKFGDFATNVAMIVAKGTGQHPIDAANAIVEAIWKKNHRFFSKIQVVAPGFINFFIHPNYYARVLAPFLRKRNPRKVYQPAQVPKKKRKRVNFEYVSANPTGALHLGHVRNAYVSQSLANVFKSLGHKVVSDYWLNDMGNQIDLFEVSCLCRYLELFGKTVKFPENGYHGEDPHLVAKKMKAKFGSKFVDTQYDDAKILDPHAKRAINKFAIGAMVQQIREHLRMIGVRIQVWTSELKVYESGILEKLIDTKLKRFVYKKDGALWLKTTYQGHDDKDRVLIKNDGTRTYFLTDIGNQYLKRQRKFNLFMQVWGADHEGHFKRMKSLMPMLGIRPNVFNVVLIQMVKLVNDGQEVKLSKRKGNAVTIPDMLKMMSVDTSRWYILAQSPSSPIVIDLAKASKMDSTNPVFYVQYAHARICQLLKKVKLKSRAYPKTFDLLASDKERELVNMLMTLDPLLHQVVTSFEPHRLITFVHELAKAFHGWYNGFRLKDVADPELQKQRYYLARAVGTAIRFVLELLGVSAPRRMRRLAASK